MATKLPSLLITLALTLAAATGATAESAKPHRVAIQVDQNDEAVMTMALNNAKNVLEHYRAKHEDAEVEIVAYGPGLHMLRQDTSPVKDRIRQMAEVDYRSKISFSACDNTKRGMEKREGHPIAIIPQATVVPAGVARLMELQEQGWSYVRP